MGSVYKHRDGGLQACANVGGRRKKKNFPETKKKQAWSWIHEMEKVLAKPTEPLLGGPRKVTLGALLHRYAELYTFSKKSRTSELSRINRYLVACGLPAPQPAGNGLSLGTADVSRHESPRRRRPGLPRTFAEFATKRRANRAKSNALRQELARTVVAEIDKAKLRTFVATMQSEGLAASTIRLEMALLKHAFNMAINEWAWEDFVNPLVGFKLPKAAPPREVTFASDDERRLRTELARSDSPYLLPYLELAIETTQRRGSLLKLEWSNVDLARREAIFHDTKSGYNVTVPLTRRAQAVLMRIPRQEDDPRVLPISADSLDAAWDRACERAGLAGLRKHDMRHVGSTRHAKRLRSTTMLMQITGHRTLSMVQRYVKFMTDDVLEALDATEESFSKMPLPDDGSGLASTSVDHERCDVRDDGCEESATRDEPACGEPSARFIEPEASTVKVANVVSFAEALRRRGKAA